MEAKVLINVSRSSGLSNRKDGVASDFEVVAIAEAQIKKCG
jgi:hypothetical protein